MKFLNNKIQKFVLTCFIFILNKLDAIDLQLLQGIPLIMRGTIPESKVSRVNLKNLSVLPFERSFIFMTTPST